MSLKFTFYINWTNSESESNHLIRYVKMGM